MLESFIISSQRFFLEKVLLKVKITYDDSSPNCICGPHAYIVSSLHLHHYWDTGSGRSHWLSHVQPRWFSTHATGWSSTLSIWWWSSVFQTLSRDQWDLTNSTQGERKMLTRKWTQWCKGEIVTLKDLSEVSQVSCLVSHFQLEEGDWGERSMVGVPFFALQEGAIVSIPWFIR